MELGQVSNVDSAKDYWSAGSILNCLKAVSFSINRSGIQGAVRGGQEAKSFRARTKIYFPDEDGTLPPRGSKWVPCFSDVMGYIRSYHRKPRTVKEVEDRQRITESLEAIFAHLQCLPDSDGLRTQRKERYGAGRWERKPLEFWWIRTV